MSRTLNQVIKDTAFERKVGYNHRRQDDMSPQSYYEYGFVQGAEWFNNSHEHHQIRMWQIKVFDDHDNYNGPRTYTVPATSGRDAQLMAFILDRYGHGFDGDNVDWGELELARVHTEIISSSVARGDWIEFKSGSKMPVSADTMVEVQYTSGKGCTTTAGELYWWIEPHLPDAIARYRIVDNL